MLLLYFLESVCFALILFFSFGWLNTHLPLAMSAAHRGLSDLVLYCGAGIYEELVFRGFILSILIAVFRPVFPQQKAATTVAALLGALLFSIFHYMGAFGRRFLPRQFHPANPRWSLFFHSVCNARLWCDGCGARNL